MKKNIWRILLLMYILAIFLHSAMPADLSSSESGWITGILNGLHLPVSEHVVRKTAHFLEYFGMGILLWQSTKDQRFVGYERMVLLAFACLAVPFADETIQLFSPGRSSQISDVWLDMAGAVCGLAAWTAVCRLAPQRRRRGPRWR